MIRIFIFLTLMRVEHNFLFIRNFINQSINFPADPLELYIPSCLVIYLFIIMKHVSIVGIMVNHDTINIVYA